MQYQKDEIKSRIMLIALEEFFEKGYLDASVRDIARKAGVASGNVYTYFENKEELFGEVVSPVYNWHLWPKKYNSADVADIASDNVVFDRIVEDFMKIARNYKVQFLILIEKSKGTKYENFKEDIISFATEQLKAGIIHQLHEKNIEIRNDLIFYILASTFIEGLLIILKNSNDEKESRTLIRQLLILSFNDLANRFV